MKGNKIGYEMLTPELKSKLDMCVDVSLVKSSLEVPSIKEDGKRSVYIVIDDDIVSGENMKGSIYYAEDNGDSYSIIGKRDEIQFALYDLLESNPFAFKEHTHNLAGKELFVPWENIINAPSSWHPSKHIHYSDELNVEFEDILNKPATYPPSEHTHEGSSATWENIMNKPQIALPNLFDNAFFEIHQRWDFETDGNPSFDYGDLDIIFDRWQMSNLIDNPTTITKETNGGFKVSSDSSSEWGTFCLAQQIDISKLGYIDGVDSKEFTISIKGDFSSIANVEVLFEGVPCGEDGIIDNDSSVTFSIPFSDYEKNSQVFFVINFWADATKPFEFTVNSIKLERGSVTSSHERENYELELLKCKRYYQKAKLPQGSYYCDSSKNIRVFYPLQVPMIASPAITLIDSLYYHCQKNSSSVKVLDNFLDFDAQCNSVDISDEGVGATIGISNSNIASSWFGIMNTSAASTFSKEHEIILDVGY